MNSVSEAKAIAGKGLKGDRYFDQPKYAQLTLIEAEAIEAMASGVGYALSFGDARRNIVTRGVALDDLVGVEFRVGEITVRGTKLSEPCAHLASLTDERVLRGLAHKGGIKAEILSDGIIRVGDRVVLIEAPVSSVADPAG